MRTVARCYFDYFLYFSFVMVVLLVMPRNGYTETSQPESTGQPQEVESLMAGLSDEQVRQMLITELQKDVQGDQYTQQQKMVGPAGMFHRLLKRLSSEHDDNEEQYSKLWEGIPNVIPDLHKVFLTL